MSRIVVRTHRQELLQRRRILVVVGGVTFIVGFFVGFVAGTISANLSRRPAKPATTQTSTGAAGTPRQALPPPAEPATSGAQDRRSPAPPVDAPVVAWQPSHQGGKNRYGYEEYKAMGSLAGLAASRTASTRSVIAWETGMGLTGSNALPKATNTAAFDRELRIANEASATYFLGLQTDVSDKTGVIVYYQENDEAGAELARFLADRLSATTGMNNLGRLGVRFYSLDPLRNRAPYRVTVELRDSEAGLTRSSSPARQRQVSRALASAIDLFVSQNR